MPPTPQNDVELLNVLQSIGQADMERVGLGTPDKPADDTTEKSESSTTLDPKPAPPVPPLTTRVSPGTLFSHPDTHPVIIDLALLNKYGAEWLEWEPETVQFEVQRDFGAISDLNFSKAMALKTMHLVDSFWQQWEVFNWCCASLNSLFPDFEVMQVPTVAQVMVAVDIANRVREDVQWSEEVRIFIGKVHEHDGIFVPQPPVDTIAIIEPHDFGIDLNKVRAEWPAVRVAGQVKTEGPEAEQLRRMLTVHEYLTESRNRLRAQLPLIQHG